MDSNDIGTSSAHQDASITQPEEVSRSGLEKQSSSLEDTHLNLKTVAVGLPAHEDDHGDIVNDLMEAIKTNEAIKKEKEKNNASIPHPPPSSTASAVGEAFSSAMGLVEHEASVLQKCNIKTANKQQQGGKQESKQSTTGGCAKTTGGTEGKEGNSGSNTANEATSAGTPGAFRINLNNNGSTPQQPQQQEDAQQQEEDQQANATTTTTRYIDDGPATSLVTAELVTPVHAIEVTPLNAGAVALTDTCTPLSSHASIVRDIEQGRAGRRNSGLRASTQSIDSIRQSIKEVSTGVQEDKRRNEYLLVGLLLGLIVALAVAVPVSLKMTKSSSNGNDGDTNNNNSNDLTTAPPVWHGKDVPPFTFTPTPSPPEPQQQSPTPEAATVYDYPCFNSTDQLNWAILLNPEETVFVFCPNTRIRVGELYTPKPNHTEFVNGDSPIVVCRQNLTIQCGPDGSVDNRCVLEGGQTQFATQTTLSDSVATLQCPPTDDLTVRGITFTGKLSHHSFWGSKSVVLSNPGKSVRFVDCKWENTSAQSGLFYVGLNLFQEINTGEQPGFPKQSIDLQIINSTFRNVVYDGPVFRVYDQNVTLKGCTFRNIQLPHYINACPEEPTAWCQGLMYCWGQSHCVIEDTVVDDLSFFGNAALLTVSSNSTWSVSNVTSPSWHLHLDKQSEVTHGLEGEICSSGVGCFHNDTTIKCIELEQ